MSRVLILVLALLLSATASGAGLTGHWNTEKSDAGSWLTVDIQPCGKKLCGTIVELHQVKDKSLLGVQMIKGMKKKSGTAYSKGKIYAADTKKWYRSKMNLKADGNLKVSGCILGGIVCRSQVWTRP
ncbi:hypothetical protein AB833_29590 [Chromatiales bacterium (ex Bugula neritina AB1)]|nr:hypothetical protein AB833_29590 [Chromatiales bacterium (ex Bugula neritina AB1)]